MKLATLFTLGLIFSLNTALAQRSDDLTIPKSTNLELPRIQVYPIEDTNNDRQYELFIKVPAAYHDSPHLRYPVIYYTDAVWHVEMVSGITEYMMENVILVGISWQKDNAENQTEGREEFFSRFRDYSFQENEDPERQAKYQFGQADKHLNFIRKDVFHFVESHFRVDPDNRTYFGYSLGGLFGAYILMAQPDAFKNYILGSPSLWRGVSYLSELKPDEGLDANVFISNGTEEEALGKHVDEFVSMLKNRGDERLSLIRELIEGTHQTASPLTVVRGVRWLVELNKPGFTLLEGHYMGQKPPGLIPEVFAPGIISLDGHFEGSITFNPDMTELFFQRRKSEETHNIYTMKLINGKWSKPELAFFSQNKEYLDLHPRFSPNGDRLYFGSTRPLCDPADSLAMQLWLSKKNSERLHQWYVEKDGSRWSQPVLLLEDLFEGKWIMCVTSSENGNLYFNSKEKEDKLENEGIYYTMNQGGEYSELTRMEATINGYGKWIAHPFVAPDESYILYDAERTSGKENGDLYVSFNHNGTWSESYGLGGEINNEMGQGSATVSPDGKYLFFTSSQKENKASDLYWVSTEVIGKLKPDK
mgnify:CR=1 FL=1